MEDNLKDCKNIVVVAGPNIGVLDFKSESTLQYLKDDFLRDFKLPTKESLFMIEYYKKKPEAFWQFAR